MMRWGTLKRLFVLWLISRYPVWKVLKLLRLKKKKHRNENVGESGLC